jgi:hypothetical protein
MTLPGPRKSIRFPCFARLTAFSLALAGCASVPPPDVASFGVLGDTPYSALEAERLDLVIDEINREKLAFVVHVGDIGGSTQAQACGDAWLVQRKVQFTRIRHPFLLIPGDNEWSECASPLERLKRWRETFCYTETIFRLVRQQNEYCEHVRWEAGGRVFVTLNIPGNSNNVDHPEHAGRMAAAFEWLDEAAKLGKPLVVLFQANPFVPRPGYESLRKKLQSMAPLLVIHGDTHVYKTDEPLPGVQRVEVWGSPFVAWTRLPLSEPPNR